MLTLAARLAYSAHPPRPPPSLNALRSRLNTSTNTRTRAYSYLTQPKATYQTRMRMLQAGTLGKKPARNPSDPLLPTSSPSSSATVSASGAQTPSHASNRQPKGAKLRGRKDDTEAVRTSKTLSWLLRHGSESVHLPMRPDGFARVDQIVSCLCPSLTIHLVWRAEANERWRSSSSSQSSRR